MGYSEGMPDTMEDLWLLKPEVRIVSTFPGLHFTAFCIMFKSIYVYRGSETEKAVITFHKCLFLAVNLRWIKPSNEYNSLIE